MAFGEKLSQGKSALSLNFCLMASNAWLNWLQKEVQLYVGLQENDLPSSGNLKLRNQGQPRLIFKAGLHMNGLTIFKLKWGPEEQLHITDPV